MLLIMTKPKTQHAKKLGSTQWKINYLGLALQVTSVTVL